MKNNTAERMQELTTRLAQYPLQLATQENITVSYRENGIQSDKTIVFLHGIELLPFTKHCLKQTLSNYCLAEALFISSALH